MYLGPPEETTPGRPAAPPSGWPDPTPDDLLHALEEAHEFPGYYPIVVIARTGEDFEELLRYELSHAQGESPYTIDARLSRNGNYVSYKVEVFVDSAQIALDRKAALADLDGVLMLL